MVTSASKKEADAEKSLDELNKELVEIQVDRPAVNINHKQQIEHRSVFYPLSFVSIVEFNTDQYLLPLSAKTPLESS